MKFTIRNVSSLLVAMLAITTNSQAAEFQAKTLLYISPNDYNYSVRLLHPYYNYWFEQGPLIEPVALAALKDKFVDVGLCKANETADTIIKIKPHLFYNPQLQVYHSKIVATVYSGNGHLYGTYVGEAQQQGFISVDIATKSHITKAYAVAMQQLMTKLPLNQPADEAKLDTKLTCAMIGAQGEARVNLF